MAKSTLEPTTPQSVKKKLRETEQTPPLPPLSPVIITGSHNLTAVNGMIASVSPIKPSKYFDGEFIDGDGIIHFVGFSKEQCKHLHSVRTKNQLL